MFWHQIFEDGPEYEARKKQKGFVPPNISLKDIHAAVPKHLHERSTAKGLYYVLRHLAVTFLFYKLATHIDALVTFLSGACNLGPWTCSVLGKMLWIMYGGWQGLSFAGIWVLGHEAGHDELSSIPFINDVLGILLHSFVLTPYYSWRATHRSHHKGTNSLERDETYIPPTRKFFKLPDGKVAVKMDYKELLEETPAFTLFKMFMRQFFGFQLYLIHNRKGNPKYPAGTSHYHPSSLLFKPHERPFIVISNICMGVMLALLGIYIYNNSWSNAWKFYFLPWFFQHNWMVTFTYLQHSDPTVPYYRQDQWTFARGALATVDRPFFGWVDRFFLHNMNHDHVAHHFFSSIPFYNLPMVTEAIKPVLGEYYNYDSTWTIYALWRSFTQCVFVEDEGGVVFFKNQQGEAVRHVDEKYAGGGALNSESVLLSESNQ